MSPDPSVFKALSDCNRIIIVSTLADGECCACRLQGVLDVTQPTLSHHMKVLQQCGIVKMRKKGTCSYYSLDTDKLDEIVDYLNEIRNRAEKNIVEIEEADVMDARSASGGVSLRILFQGRRAPLSVIQERNQITTSASVAKGLVRIGVEAVLALYPLQHQTQGHEPLWTESRNRTKT